MIRPSWPPLPSPYHASRVRGALLLAVPAVEEVARGAIERAGSLLSFAEADAGARALRSRRGAAWLISPAGSADQWVVRHYRRGGLMARLLRDRHLRLGTPRPLRELRVSHGARERGIETPEVLAAAIHPAGPFYRADLVTRFVADSANLAELLFEPGGAEPARRRAALEAAGRLVRRMHRRGLLHADLNLQNLLVSGPPERPLAHVLDLDRCALLEGSLPAARAAAVLRRLERSVLRWEQRTGRSLAAAERRALLG